VGALNMGEYAYDFTGENAHYGPSRNPHDTTRMSGGSSGGSGAAVGAALVPLALGSDTNGSIRMPASLCGVFGLKPTYGRLSRSGAFLFAASFDHLGPLARTTGDLALAYDAMQGADPDDPAQAPRETESANPLIDRGIAGLRLAVADGYFGHGGAPVAHEAVATVASALGIRKRVALPEAQRARAAAFVITAVEGANLHAARLKARPDDFDPDTRDRFFAGLMIPGHWYAQAQRFRRWYRDQVAKVFEEVDAIIAPCAPLTAPALGQKTMRLDGVELPVRANLGVFTQPISFIGLPVVAAPLAKANGADMPIAVQIVAAPWREDLCLRISAALERAGVVAAWPAPK
jgi:AtzE family amidohydrolase